MDIETRLNELKYQLSQLPPFHPGKLTQQYIRCGKQNCHCRDVGTAKRHGPYYQLSYAVNGKHSTVFIKEEQRTMIEKYLENYQTFKSIVAEITELTAQIVRIVEFGKKS